MNDVPLPCGYLGPSREPTEEEQETYQRMVRKQQHQAVWMNYSIVSMQCIKLQSEQFTKLEEIAIKAARLADLMLEQYCNRE